MSLTEEQKSRLVFLDSVQDGLDEEYDLMEAIGLNEDEEEEDEKETLSDHVKSASIERITSSLKITKSYSDPIAHYSAKKQLLSYPVSRIIVSLTDNPFLFYMFSISEARRFINLSKKASNPIKTSRETESERYDQVKILHELGYDQVTTDSVPIDLYLSKVPTEEEPMTETVSRYNNQKLYDDGVIELDEDSDTKENPDEILDRILFWVLVEEIREDLPVDVPDKIADEVESEVVEISQKIPNKFKVSKRGLAEDASYQNISKLIEHTPPVFRQTAHKLRENEPVSTLRRDMLLRTLMDCGVSAEDISDWLGYESEWTESYGHDELFDLQGDIQYEEYGFISYSITDLQEKGVFSNIGTVHELTEYSPVYTVLKKNNQLHPATIRD